MVIATVPTAPTWTATPQPTAIPIATATPTHTPTPLLTPTRTPSAAEIRAARLPALANLTWRAEGNKVVLGDGVATLDEKTGGVR